LDLPLRKFQQLLDISAERNLKDPLKPVNLFLYWPLRSSGFPEISKHAVRQLLPFVSTYCSEAAFFKYALIKIKHRSTRSRIRHAGPVIQYRT
jgi:hypothetical protein